MKRHAEHIFDEHLALESYEALNFEALQRRANYQHIAYREDILHICEEKGAAAIVYQVVSRRLERRKEEILIEIERRRKAGESPLTPQEVENLLWVSISSDDCVRGSGGAVDHNAAMYALDYLLNTKEMLERRGTSNPRFAEYEYRIRKATVRKLLSDLPIYPCYQAREATSPQREKSARTLCDERQDPNGGGISLPTGVGIPPDAGLSQILSQETARQQPGTQAEAYTSMQAAPAGHSLLPSLSNEALPLVSSTPLPIPQANRQPLRLSSDAEPERPAAQRPEPPAPTSHPLQVSEPSGEKLVRPGCDTLLTDISIVQLWEYLRKARYSINEQNRELQAAQELLHLAPTLPLPLSIDLLEQVYRRFFDTFWRRKFHGILNVSHLVQIEESSGQIRIVRWLAMVRDLNQSPAPFASASEGLCNALAGLTEEELRGRGHQRWAQNDQMYTRIGVDAETLMKLSPEARAAVIRQLRKEGERSPSSAPPDA